MCGVGIVLVLVILDLSLLGSKVSSDKKVLGVLFQFLEMGPKDNYMLSVSDQKGSG